MDLPKLNCDVEEANTSIIPHLNKISLNKSAFAVVLSVTQIYVFCYYVTGICFRITDYLNFGCEMEKKMRSKSGTKDRALRACPIIFKVLVRKNLCLMRKSNKPSSI